MVNQFDFFAVEAHSKSIRALMGIGLIKRKDIQTKCTYKGAWRVTDHKVIIKFYNVLDGHDVARSEAYSFMATLPKIEGVRYIVKFNAVD